jgi:hypothetical protein
VQFVGESLEGVSKPIGGDDEAVFHVDDEQKDHERAAEIARRLEHAQLRPRLRSSG